MVKINIKHFILCVFGCGFSNEGEATVKSMTEEDDEWVIIFPDCGLKTPSLTPPPDNDEADEVKASPKTLRNEENKMQQSWFFCQNPSFLQLSVLPITESYSVTKQSDCPAHLFIVESVDFPDSPAPYDERRSYNTLHISEAPTSPPSLDPDTCTTVSKIYPDAFPFLRKSPASLFGLNAATVIRNIRNSSNVIALFPRRHLR